jgi:hypothetical protein
MTPQLFSGNSKIPPIDFDGTRSASSLFYWASGNVPLKLTRTQNAKGIAEIVAKVRNLTTSVLPRAHVMHVRIPASRRPS